ncbi:DUF998 domain-containing protein [Halobium salinum]|uniref:DUF998 domain-containing protein n=1 Tax=Halobium salinum TaxID=1364940 RepID=A0ABD5P798_9EURY|nr:DUF998 domain-containing protein [Halobium salinum]
MHRHAAALLSGFAAPLVTLSAILAATLVSPTFAWGSSALSDLGVAPATALLFNGGLVVGGLLALPYTAVLWDADPEPLSRAAAASLALAAVAMGLVGVFPSDQPLHVPVAVAFFLLLTVTMVLDGLARRDTTTGSVALRQAGVHVVVWVGWILGYVPGGLAVPEIVGAALFGVWVLLLSPIALWGRKERETAATTAE